MVHRLSFAGVLAALLIVPVNAEQVNEYYIKAAYVYNLAKFVEWPPQSFSSTTDPIAICVLGESPIQNALAEAVNGESVDNRKLIIHRLTSLQQGSKCQLLFVASSERKHWRSIAQDWKNSGVLTVGETEDFLALGGAVNFHLEGNKVRIEINMTAVEQQKLRISPKLLSLARIVRN